MSGSYLITLTFLSVLSIAAPIFDCFDEIGRKAREFSGKPIESVWFAFSGYKSTDLCMTYDGYQGIQLHDATRHTPWCKCK